MVILGMVNWLSSSMLTLTMVCVLSTSSTVAGTDLASSDWNPSCRALTQALMLSWKGNFWTLPIIVASAERIVVGRRVVARLGHVSRRIGRWHLAARLDDCRLADLDSGLLLLFWRRHVDVDRRHP